MKNLKRIEKKFESLAQIWLQAIDTYTEEQFVHVPAEGSWSIGQLYNHLINSAKNLNLKNIALCDEGKGTTISGGKKVPGAVTYFFGRIPPVRIKVPPSPTYTPKQPANKAEVKENFIEVIRLVKESRGKAEKALPIIKVAHPAFGFLNAAEWFQLLEMHYRHHLRQKKRLDLFLGVK